METKERDRWERQFADQPLHAMDILLARANTQTYERFIYQATYDRFFAEVGAPRLHAKMHGVIQKALADFPSLIQKEHGISSADLRIAQTFFSQMLGQSMEEYFTEFVGIPSEWPLRLMSLPQGPGGETQMATQFQNNLENLLSHEENFTTWVDSKRDDFTFFISSVLLPKLKENSGLYQQLVAAREVSMHRINFLQSDDPSFLALPPGESVVPLAESENVYGYVFRTTDQRGKPIALLGYDTAHDYVLEIPSEQGVVPFARFFMRGEKGVSHMLVSWFNEKTTRS